MNLEITFPANASVWHSLNSILGYVPILANPNSKLNRVEIEINSAPTACQWEQLLTVIGEIKIGKCIYLKGVDVPNKQIKIQWKGTGCVYPVNCPTSLSAWKKKISIIDLITRYN